ncbi:MAG: metallophosphoesterase family protein [Candidatus Bathyarchaeia archaeon]
MQANLSQIVKEAFEASLDFFLSNLEEASGLICNEKGNENYEVYGRLAKVLTSCEALIIGDLHGDLESLTEILNKSMFLEKMGKNAKAVMVFLGDYGDRGLHSAEVYYVILKLKLLYPEQVILMRGNHEGPEDLLASPHDLPWQFQLRFGEGWNKAYRKVQELFRCLYSAVLVEERYLMVHGGPPIQAKTIEDLAYAHIRHPEESLLEDILWSDPHETVKEVCASPRGAGKLFGEKVTEETLKRFGVKTLIRGHEPCHEGFKISHGGKVLTLFSRKGPPYHNIHGAYLLLKLNLKFHSATQLIPYIYRF